MTSFCSFSTMNVLMQRLSRLRSAYPALLRLGSDNGNHLHWMFDALPKHKYNTPSAAKIDPGRSLEVPVVTDPAIDNNSDGPEMIQENMFAHNIFLNSWKYANTVMQPSKTYAHVTNEEALKILEQDWSLMTNVEMVSAIKKLSYNICHNGEEKIDPIKYTRAFSNLKLTELTNDELIMIMQHLVPFSNYMKKYNFYIKLFVRIDRECMIRFLQLPREKMLYLCDVIYQMTPKIQQYSQYIWYSIKYLGNKPHKLSPQQLIQILFFLNIYRKPPINMYELEYQLERCKDELSINELAIASLGFFKTSTKIRSIDFLVYIIQRTITEIDAMDSVSIASIIKLVRYSMVLIERKSFIALLKVMIPYEPRYTLITLIHILQACGRIAIYNKELIDRLSIRLNKELKTARLKDFERFLYSFSILNVDSSNNVYQNIVEELRATWDTTRAFEIEKFPYVPTRILGYLVTQNVFPMDLIERVMTPEYINKTCYGNYHVLSREYLVLDYSLRIEVPEYNGPLLKPSVRNFLEKKYYDLYLKSGSATSTKANLLFSDVLTTCQEMFNTTTDISIIRPLPYFTSQDIIFCLDERNQLVPSEKYFSQFKQSDIKRVDKENSNVRWIALILGHHGLLIRNYQNRPTGALAAKLRQMSIIGYTPVMISYMIWDVLKSPQEKHNYIKNLISR